MKTCTHHESTGRGGGICHHPKIHVRADGSNRSVSSGVCRTCQLNDGGSKWKAFLKKHRLGDKAAKGIGAVPGIKKLPCYDEQGELRPESPCGRRRRKMNGG